MLIREPGYPRQMVRRTNTWLSWKQERAQAAYAEEEAADWDNEQYPDADDGASYEAEGEQDAAAYEEERYAEGADEADPDHEGQYDANEADFSDYAAGEEEADGDDAYEQADGEAEQGWDGDEESIQDIDEARALVPLDDGMARRSGMLRRTRKLPTDGLVVFEEPGMALPVFIAGTLPTPQPGVLGHHPLAPRATRPRPFYMHSLLMGMMIASIVIAVVALVPISGNQPLIASFRSLAGFIAPPAPPVVQSRPYTVHYGDTLESIANKFGVQQGGILEINQFESGDQLYFGMHIKIPVDPNYGQNFHPLLDIPLAPTSTPAPPYGYGIVPPGFDSFGVRDYFGDIWAGSFGQCTWWAHHKRPDENFYNFGDAWNWANAARAAGYTVTSDPVANATVVFAPGAEEAGGLGHVAHVEQLLSGGWILISEMNFTGNGGGWGRVDYRYITPGPGIWFIH
jgi:LysM repeat protein